MNVCAVAGMSAVFALRIVPPPSCTSAAASSAWRSKMPAMTACNTAARSSRGFRRHTPVRCARRAAATASSTSAAPAAETVAQGSPVAGLIVSYVAPSRAARQSPSMKSR